MRMHDRLMVETPQPYGADKPMTMYAETFGEAQVIDATEVIALFLEMERDVMAQAVDDGKEIINEVWMAQRFCEFDWSALTMNMPPFETFVMEFDAEQAMQDSYRAVYNEQRPVVDRTFNLGQSAVAVTTVSRETYLSIAETVVSPLRYGQDVRDVFDHLMSDPEIKWVLCMSTFLQIPLRPILGPMVSFTLPVRADGSLVLKPDGEPLSLVAPADPRWGESENDRIVNASKYLYLSVIPTMMAINFMHTPQGDKGYHNRVPMKPLKKGNKHYQRKHFRPLTSWHMLDIAPLRQAFEHTLGRTPRSPSEFAKAMHVVRGNTATYAPNTYFGKPHAEPITVFRPAHRRGDITSGRVDKDYRLDTGT